MNTSDISTWKVLIVEDDPDNLNVAIQVLSFHGAEVYTAQDGQQGLQKLAEVRPTFVLLDLSMPHMDGWEMLRRLRADAALAHLPVIALTAHAMTGDAEKALAAGFDGYITKPFDIFSFIDQLKTNLASLNGRVSGSPAAPAAPPEPAVPEVRVIPAAPAASEPIAQSQGGSNERQ